MVAKPAPRADTGPGIGRSVEAAFRLWIRSALPALGFSLGYGLAGLLPLAAFATPLQELLRFSQLLLRSAFESVPMSAFDAQAQSTWLSLSQALLSPTTIALIAGSSLLALFAIAALMVCQWRIANGEVSSVSVHLRAASRRLPACVGAWLVYLAILLLLTLPPGLLTWAVMATSVHAADHGVAAVLALFLGFLLGSALLSVPLVWGSVAFSLAPFVSAADGSGPIAAQQRSRRLVRGRWLQCALVVAIPMAIYLGIGSMVSSALMGICIGVATATGGSEALLEGRWLVWSQWLALLPMALALPLAFAGGTQCLVDFLREDETRAAQSPTSSI